MDRNNLLLVYDHTFSLSPSFYCTLGSAFHAIDGYTFALLPEAFVGYRHQWGAFHLDFSLGLQVGVAKIRSIDQVLFSISPIGTITAGFRFHGYDISSFLDMRHPIDRTWKATFLCGGRLEKEVSENLLLGVESWARRAEYLMDNWTMIDSLGVRVYVSSKGGAR